MAPRAYDTVIVGAGSSGCVIAARMTESSARGTVLLVEAGPDYPDAWPDDLVDGTRNSLAAHDWGYTHRPTAKSLVFPMPRGRLVGGSSAVNTCIALRGVAGDYDEWAARGLPAWSWDQCLPAFVRLERDLDCSDDFHGQDGPLPVRRHTESELAPWQAAFVDACRDLGFAAVKDHNAPGAEGVGPHAMNKLDGVRMNAAFCWLTPAVRARPQLTVRPHTIVRRVLWEGRRVRGVEVETHGVVRDVACRRVVLCAGALSTPGILLRSGVGPRADVARMGVPLVREVPAVGRALLDHPGTAVFLWPKEGVTNTSLPLIQTALRTTAVGSTLQGSLQVQAGSFWMFPWATLPGVSLMMHVGKPKGVGSLVFPRFDPRGAPRIASRFFAHPDDRAVALQGLALMRALTERPALRDMARVVWPRPDTLADPAASERLLPYHCDSGYHPCGTVPMGDDGAVDARGRFDGLDGLVVADASLMPTIPTANIHLAVLMIGERFGAWLRDGAI